MSKKYYWLKLKKDFFKRHDIKILEAMPDGHLSVLFYLKLMLESIDHEGRLRFSDEVPYSPEMLAIITDTNLDVVNDSLKRLQELKLLEITQDGTIVIDKVKTMTGFETEWARKKKEYREKKGQNKDKVKTSEGQIEDNVLPLSDKSKSKSKSKSIELDIKEKSIKEKNTSRFIPPTLEEVTAYCQERNSCVDPKQFFDYFTTGNWKDSKGNQVKNWKQKLITWEKLNENRSQNTTTAISTYKPSGNVFTALKQKESYRYDERGNY